MNLFLMFIVPYGCVVHNYIFIGPIGDQGFYTHLYQGFMLNGKQRRHPSKKMYQYRKHLDSEPRM